MKYCLFFLLFFFSTLIAEEDSTSTTSKDIRTSSIHIGPVYQRYQLDMNSVGFFHGNTWGGFAYYTYAKPWGLYANLGAEASSGNLFSQLGSSEISQIEFLFTEKIGYNIPWGKSQQHTLTLYTGYNYLWWRQHLNITGYNPFIYTYKKPYIPFGFNLNFTATDWLSFGVNYTFLFAIETHVNISATVGSDWFLKRKNDQMLEFPLLFKIRDRLHISLIPFYRSLKMGSSTAVTDTGLRLGLQENSYQIWGGKFELAFYF